VKTDHFSARLDVYAIDKAIANIQAGNFTLPDELLHTSTTLGAGIEGFSSPRVRELLHYLCSFPGAHYLEVGVYLGSTFIPAMYNNNARGIAVDNWSLFEGDREKFETNLHRYLPVKKVEIVEQDYKKVALDDWKDVNIFFYDGPHTVEDQYQALIKFYPCLAKRFVFMVDDFNWFFVRVSTRRAIRDLKLKVVKWWLLPGPYDGIATEDQPEQWWNGIYLAILEKQITTEHAKHTDHRNEGTNRVK
jgi:hypothetical protein